jgi:hypothetical protein
MVAVRGVVPTLKEVSDVHVQMDFNFVTADTALVSCIVLLIVH